MGTKSPYCSSTTSSGEVIWSGEVADDNGGGTSGWAARGAYSHGIGITRIVSIGTGGGLASSVWRFNPYKPSQVLVKTYKKSSHLRAS
ncbi:hypothetical protein LguiB_003357 [Lonicera macranthoides]